jgi:hypothetical protein
MKLNNTVATSWVIGKASSSSEARAQQAGNVQTQGQQAGLLGGD